MKRAIAFVLTIILGTVLTGCAGTAQLTLPFAASDVESVEIFHYIVPADAEKKTVTRPDDIAGLFETFDGLSLKDKETEPAAGSSTTSFRFRLSDGTVYEIMYSSLAVKSGRIRTTAAERDFFTSADITACWSNCASEAAPAIETELPVFP